MMVIRRMFRVFMILGFVLLLSVPAFAEPAGLNAPDANPLASYRLGVDDRIKVTVFGEPDLSGSYSVAADGSLSMPLIGSVRVMDLSIPEVERQITDLLLDGYLVAPSVAIEVERYRPFYILGEVHVPGRYDYVNHMSVLNAVALAGGFTYRAKQGHVKVMRSDTGDDYQKIDAQDAVLPGDVILVEERFF